MIPLRDDNPTLHGSSATFVLIALNAAVWFFVQGFGSHPTLGTSVCEYGVIPGDLLGTAAPGTVVPIGRGLACVLQGDPSWLTMVTSMFMHGGWFHIIGNLWFLYVFGDNVEDAMGAWRFTAFYILCGIAAAAAQMLANPASVVPMVGASGAIGGVMGAYAVLYPRTPVHMLVVLGFYVTRIVLPAYVMLGYWFLVQLVGGVPTLRGEGAGVAFWAHVGGFAAGVVLVLLFRDPQRLARHRAALAQHRR